MSQAASAQGITLPHCCCGGGIEQLRDFGRKGGSVPQALRERVGSMAGPGRTGLIHLASSLLGGAAGTTSVVLGQA